ncbi:polysaccharide deacetylase family protein [Humitalea sp. 24SJ18S-53]|uniref:polysaccharide deacetylase family protein n=1 Tax=Humitalea sp. 24SJ18S-53 TaxID=3422307 RepID=UPI003D678148
MTGPPPGAVGWRRLRAWSPAPSIRASFALHGLGAVVVAAQPQAWPQVLGVLAFNHALLTCCMHPRSAILGPNMTRLPAADRAQVALTFDDGPDPDVTPRVLDILESYGAKASFFVIGSKAARCPALLRDIVARGHTVENHTQNHPNGFAFGGPRILWREVDQAQRTIVDACGQAPRFFRAPMGLRNPFMDPVLSMAGLSLVAWTRRGYDTVRHQPTWVLDRLSRSLAARDILLLHDGNSARDANGIPIVLTVLPRLLERIAAQNLSAVSLAAIPPSTAAR